jgi:hypothetical protein
LSRVKTFDSTGLATSGRLYAGDLNAIQDQYADLYNLAQSVGVSVVAVGEAGLQITRYGVGEMRISGAVRTDGILRALGGVYAGAFTTTQRDAIALGFRPYGLIILNTTTNRLEWNSGTDATPSWQPLGSTLSMAAGTLAAQPAASSVAAGSQYFATDQVVEYRSDGSAWTRLGIPAGVTAEWFAAVAAPTGWVSYDGSNLPGSTGIYAALATHLGGIATPDTRGRVTVAQGTHADVSAIGSNDGVAVGSRRPKHSHTNGLTLPNHGHGITDPGHVHNIVNDDSGGPMTNSQYKNAGQPIFTGSAMESAVTGITVGNPTSNPAISGTIGLATAPVDGPGYIVALKIAKL